MFSNYLEIIVRTNPIKYKKTGWIKRKLLDNPLNGLTELDNYLLSWGGYRLSFFPK